MDDLVQWLRAQLDVDAARAEDAAAARGGHWSAQALRSGRKERHYVGASRDADVTHMDSEVLSGSAAVVSHAATHDPARVLREIDAKRQLLDKYAEVAANDINEVEYAHGWANALGEAVRLLAMPYADRPGYRPEWRP